MTLNRAQRHVLLAALTVFAASVLVPPWTRVLTLFDATGRGGAVEVRQTSRYAPIWSPPKRYTFARGGADTYFIDWQRLFLSTLAVAAISALLVAFLADKKTT